jgi:hypothetical protein
MTTTQLPINRSGRSVVLFYQDKLTIFPPATWKWQADGDGGVFTIKQQHIPAAGPKHLEFLSFQDPYDLDDLPPAANMVEVMGEWIEENEEESE